jgi:molecular chaperone DnaK
VGQYFGEEPIDYINPDEVVALGAAIQGFRLTEVSEDPAPVLLDVTSQTLGVATVGGFIEPLIARNTPIPTMASKVFHTAKDNQTQVKIRVHQGDQREARKNYMLGDFVLEGLPEGPRGHARVRVTFNIDSNGMVNVTATSSGTGATKEIRVEATSSLTPDQVEELRFSQEQSSNDNSGAVEPTDSLLVGQDSESESLDLDRDEGLN